MLSRADEQYLRDTQLSMGLVLGLALKPTVLSIFRFARAVDPLFIWVEQDMGLASLWMFRSRLVSYLFVRHLLMQLEATANAVFHE